MPDLKPREWAAIVPLIVMMVWMGMYSQSFLPVVGKTTARILEQTQVNVEIRVKAPAAPRPSYGGGACPLTSLPTSIDYIRFLPEIILIAAGTMLMVLDVILRKQIQSASTATYPSLALIAALAAAVLCQRLARSRFLRHADRWMASPRSSACWSSASAS